MGRVNFYIELCRIPIDKTITHTLTTTKRGATHTKTKHLKLLYTSTLKKANKKILSSFN